MNITNPQDLVNGYEYWYLSVENNCHWIIKVKSFIYQSKNTPKSLWDMILFDDEKEAKKMAISVGKVIRSKKLRLK